VRAVLPLPSVVVERRAFALRVSEPRVLRVALPWVRVEEEKQPALRVWRRRIPAMMAQPAGPAPWQESSLQLRRA
jgi:hypothetical protein